MRLLPSKIIVRNIIGLKPFRNQYGYFLQIYTKQFGKFSYQIENLRETLDDLSWRIIDLNYDSNEFKIEITRYPKTYQLIFDLQWASILFAILAKMRFREQPDDIINRVRTFIVENI